jgi:hypothetical protein
MKLIQILIAGIALLYAGLKVNAQTDKDTVQILYKGKTYKIDTKIDPQEEERNRTLKFVDTLKKNMVLVTVKTKVYDGKDWSIQDENATHGDSNDMAKFKKMINLMTKTDSGKRKHFIETRFLPNFDLGFTSTMNEFENTSTFTPKLGKSANINLGIISQNMNLYKGRVLFSYGFSLNNYYLKYNNKQVVQYVDQQGLLKSYIDTVNNFDKNRLDVRYLSVPVLLEYHSKNNKFAIAGGVEFGFNGHTKVTRKGDKGSQEFKHKDDNDVKISPEQVTAVLKISIHDISIYGRYSITDMYRPSAYASGQNPHQHLFSFGVCLFGI